MQPLLAPLLLLFPLVTALAGRGSTPFVLNVTYARSAPAHPMKFNTPVTLWCAPDNPQVTIQKAEFVRRQDGKRFPAVATPNKKNASLTLPETTVEDAGEYVCEMETTHGRLTYSTHIYLRPVVVSDEHFTAKETDAFSLSAPGIMASENSEVTITCPVVGHPTPVFKWTKDGKPLEMNKNVEMEGSSVKLNSLSYDQGGVYNCETINEYPIAGRRIKTLLSIERDLNVKSEWAWVYPLAVIIIILVLLVIIIVLCEIRRKKLDRKSLYTVQE